MEAQGDAVECSPLSLAWLGQPVAVDPAARETTPSFSFLYWSSSLSLSFPLSMDCPS